MKKLLTIILALVMSLVAVSAFAAGKLNVEQENFYTINDGSRIYSYVFAKIENTGNKPIMINAGLLEVFDADGDPITSTDSFSSYARYLEPGEYTYYRMSTKIEDATIEDVDDYMLTVSGKSDMDQKCVRLECTAEYRPNEKIGYSPRDYLYATFTNNTDQTLYAPRVCFALLDEEENILFVVGDYLDSNQAILPNSSLLIRLQVDTSFVSYMEQNNIIPASVDAIAYCYVEND